MPQRRASSHLLLPRRFFPYLLPLLVAACGRSGLSSGDPEAPDAGVTPVDACFAPVDAARLPDLSFMPAPHPALPEIPYSGGPTLQNPSLVTVVWEADPLASELASFDAWIVQSGRHRHRGHAPRRHPPRRDPAGHARSPLQRLPTRRHEVTAFGYQSCTQFQAYHDVGATTPGGVTRYTVTPRCRYPGIADIDVYAYPEGVLLASATTGRVRNGDALPLTVSVDPGARPGAGPVVILRVASSDYEWSSYVLVNVR